MKSRFSIIAVAAAALFLTSCATINPGEVGVKVKRGVLDKKIYTSGQVPIGPYAQLIKVPVRTVNKEVKLNLPSKEGLNVKAEISILYHIESADVPQIIEEIGTNYEEVVILSVFRSASADICAQFYAKDMHSGKRGEIEKEILNKMTSLIGDRGFTIEAVLMKSISLPPGLYAAIEDKLEAEQESQRMEFILQKERQEAQRKIIEAQGTADAQKILADGLNQRTIEWKSLEVLNELSKSPNTKVIITDGKTPFIVNDDDGKQ
ncbi:MAG: spfh domain, band 7 family protein [Bacteroidetes bacterium]|nr:MAG: spfh domain, band 7 family protein [Bacteroidota bacterium]